jgi:hypothetical protein
VYQWIPSINNWNQWDLPYGAKGARIDVDDTTGEPWIIDTNGNVWKYGSLPSGYGQDPFYRTSPWLYEEGLQHGIVTGRYYEQLADSSYGLRVFEEFEDMNLGWIRIEFEHKPKGIPATSVAAYQEIIQRAHDRNIKVLGVVGLNSMDGTLDWSGNTLTQDSVNRYVAAVDSVLSTFAIDAVEILNEPRVYYFTQARLPQYARLLITVYDQLKPKYPGVPFVAPVTSQADATEWIGTSANREASIFNSAIMRSWRDSHSGLLPFDVVSWHPYGSGGNPTGNFYYNENGVWETMATYHARVMGYKDIQNRSIVGAYPVWITEYNFDSKRLGEDNHRLYVERAIAFFKSKPEVKTAFLYTYQDDDAVPGTENNTYGLVKSSYYNYAPKKLFTSFMGNSSGVGIQTGTTVVDGFVVAWRNLGGRDTLGLPSGAIISSGSGYYQNFPGTQWGTATMYKKAGLGAHLLYGPFRTSYSAGTHGWPISDRYTVGIDIFQLFENGYMKLAGGSTWSWTPYSTITTPSGWSLSNVGVWDSAETAVHVWNKEWMSDLVKTAYLRQVIKGFNPGTAGTNRLHTWTVGSSPAYTFFSQNLAGGQGWGTAWGLSAILFVKDANAVSAYTLSDGFLNLYQSVNTQCGAPTSDKYAAGSNLRQNFESGRYMLSTNNGQTAILY